MKNAVIYARYSSYKQNEMSIGGQIEECRRYAAEHDLFIIREYTDRAQSATTDKRPNFQRMIDDSEYGNFEVILVYQLDRFARNKNDSGYYKKILTGKLYCGHCMDLMMGTSGTSRHKQTYRYYTCSNAPKNCNKKNVRKDLLEERIIQTCRNLLSDAVIEKVKKAVIEQNRIDEESAELIRLKEEIKTTEGRIEKLLDQIEDGLNSIRAAERLQQREQELSELKRQLKREESKQVKLDPQRIVEYLTIVRDGSIDNIPSIRKCS